MFSRSVKCPGTSAVTVKYGKHRSARSGPLVGGGSARRGQTDDLPIQLQAEWSADPGVWGVTMRADVHSQHTPARSNLPRIPGRCSGTAPDPTPQAPLLERCRPGSDEGHSMPPRGSDLLSEFLPAVQRRTQPGHLLFLRLGAVTFLSLPEDLLFKVFEPAADLSGWRPPIITDQGSLQGPCA
jgi:hypothetical protein